MKKAAVILVLAVFVLGGATACYSEESLEATLKDLVLGGLRSNQEEDINAVLQTIHTQSPAYEKISQHLPKIFEDYDLKYELLSYTYLGTDGEYAVARIIQTTEKVDQKPGTPLFQNNRVDIIQVFRKEFGFWKFWNQVILEFEVSDQQ